MFLSSTRGRLALAPVVALLLLAAAGPAFAQPLSRDLSSYFVFAMRNTHLKNVRMLSACNVGVNCAQPTTNSSCGVAVNENVFYADGSQIAADKTRFNRGGASIFQLFTNDLTGPDNVTIREPGPGPNGTNTLALPILGNLDMDASPSCGADCNPDYGDVKAACGFPDPFPACALATPVLVLKDGDCSNVPDATPGNGRCDLAPGTYGELSVQNNGRVNLLGGDYVLCGINVGKNTSTTVSAPSRLYVSGDIDVNNASTFGESCGDLAVFGNGPGVVSFGRNSTIAGDFCAPERFIDLGHNNDLTGRFVGDVVSSDSNVRGRCCAAAAACACFDTFSPTTAAIGATITLEGSCNLSAVSAVRICGIAAPITSQTMTTIQVTVPAGIPVGSDCVIEADSPAGTFRTSGTLHVG